MTCAASMPGIGGISGSAPVATTTTSGRCSATTAAESPATTVDLDAELAPAAPPGSRGSAAPRACSAPAPGDLELAAELRRRAPRSRRRARAGARSAPPPCPPGPEPTTITRRGVRGRLDRPGQLAPDLGVHRAARALAPGRPGRRRRCRRCTGGARRAGPARTLRGQSGSAISAAAEQHEVGVAVGDHARRPARGRRAGRRRSPGRTRPRLTAAAKSTHVPARDEHRRERHVQREPGAGGDR